MKLVKNEAPYLVVTEFEFLPNRSEGIVEIWNNSEAKKILPESVLYQAIQKNTLVLLYKINQFNDAQDFIESEAFLQFVDDISEYLDSDLHQEIVALVKQVAPRENLLPTSSFMQLRHIEVPLSGIEEYLDWRERTIFDFVGRNEKVKSFVAFHSLLSSTPGVLFVTEFEGDPDEYRNSFLTPEYQKIIKEAGHDHIKDGLNTFEYRKVG
ncbi:hypothetical protein [Enterococcus gilvus]|uniref:Uncharacterized protein n=1 Tax=Enterococcus gilvus ATCC BAA-350 TaxID=1158614 RepID=R2VCT4_9ENTE|nr:hypothetical protein [Enterococcus gilvus]EOI55446.1 hypothetical protein UKC_02654 [Enterococcus gilvus ATCC BAA-350]EOW82011.1 hypothetical protein I592_01312 [Enterococcus gilvus ATCC BAA-350]OJG43040.1 hypothetical protein RV02_GL002960 [Enterococcus gilvus]